MNLTSEQQEQLRQANAQGEKRVSICFNKEQKKGWQEAVEEEMAGKEENIAHFRKIKAAAEKCGFFGDIRRAMMLSQVPLGELASAIHVAPQLLSSFRAGEAELDSDALDRLVEALELRLMKEIPR